MSIGIWQIVLILVIVLLIFGAGKLPRVMGDVAKGIKSFKAGMKDGTEAPPSNTSSTGQAPGSEERQTKSNTKAAQKDDTVQR